MSCKIGIVGEGVSDYKILKYIVERYLRDFDVYTIPLQPKETYLGKQDGYGTWQRVFSYIKGSDNLILEAVKEGCQFVIIQIDTDVCEEYNVSKNTNDEVLYTNVTEALSNAIHNDFDKSKAVYAICINEIECWLIPFISNDIGNCKKTNGCLNTVNYKIRTKGTIDKDNKNCTSAINLYNFILNHKRKVRELQAASQFNYGFKKFIEQLDAIKELLLNQNN